MRGGSNWRKKYGGFKEAFLVGFFLHIGLTGFPDGEAWKTIAVFIVLLPLKAILFFLLFMVFKLRARSGFQATTSLTAYSEFTLISGAVAASAGLIPEGWIVILALLTAVSYVINSVLSKHEDKVWESINTFLTKFQRSGRGQDRQISTLGNAEYLVIGLGISGKAAYDYLKEKNMKVVAMDIDPDRISKNIEEGRRVVYGDAQDVGLWETIDLSRLKSVLIAMSTGIDLKIHALKLLRGSEEYSGQTFVLAMNEREENSIEESGGRPVAIPAREIGRYMGELTLKK